MLRLVQFKTKEESKFEANHVIEIYGNAHSIWHIWYQLYVSEYGKHIFIYNSNGELLDPHEGMSRLQQEDWTEER